MRNEGGEVEKSTSWRFESARKDSVSSRLATSWRWKLSCTPSPMTTSTAPVTRAMRSAMRVRMWTLRRNIGVEAVSDTAHRLDQGRGAGYVEVFSIRIHIYIVLVLFFCTS